ncbi:MAG: GDP-mannose 4,6-dehydratase [Prosthecobacter sp.]|uniref:GDP-mannose 4,6-dehydratase n=1 Tax=Prosthecobacter sp. TaxID=1965333 RepID=UPI0039018F0A
MRRALIIGHEGQDGRLMSAHLRSQGYNVLGWGSKGCQGIAEFEGRSLDICDPQAVIEVMRQWLPQEVYHFAAHHHSSEQPLDEELHLFQRSVAVNLLSLVYFLQAASVHSTATRIFYAASSRVFGVRGGIVSEETALNPSCPYGISKTAALQACRYYRHRHALHISVGILFNHESSLRPGHYLSQKIVQGALAIRRGEQHELLLGSLTSGADWGYAPDMMRKIHRMVQMPAGEDFIMATGEGHTVGEFAETAFSLVGLNWRDHVRTNADLIREVRPPLVGDDTRFRAACAWTEERSFRDMIRQLIIDAGGAGFLA